MVCLLVKLRGPFPALLGAPSYSSQCLMYVDEILFTKIRKSLDKDNIKKVD